MTSNRDIALDLWNEAVVSNNVDDRITEIAAALDAAEARGRAEVVAKVLELADEFEGLSDSARIVANVADRDYGRGHAKGLSAGYYAAAQRLREVARQPGSRWKASPLPDGTFRMTRITTSSRGPVTDTDAPPPV